MVVLLDDITWPRGHSTLAIVRDARVAPDGDRVAPRGAKHDLLNGMAHHTLSSFDRQLLGLTTTDSRALKVDDCEQNLSEA